MIRFLQTPGPIKKVVLSGILLVFCGAMVITLIPGGLSTNFGFGGGPAAGVVATVGDQDVTREEVVRVAQNMLKQQFPRGNAMAAQLLPFFASRAADQLITEKALISEAHRMGFRATDEDVRDELRHGQYAALFFPGGKFIGQQAYENLLGQNDVTVLQFEEGVKDNILITKLRNLVAASASVTDKEVRQEFEKRSTKVKFQYAVIREADLRKGIHPTESELNAFYERNKATYNNSIPEKRKIAYALLDSSKIAAETQVTPEDLRSYYDQHRDEYRVPAQVNVRHILIKTPPAGPDGKVDQKALDAAKAKAEDILKQLKAGGKFEDLAKKYSEDPGSAKNGGSLGWIGRGRTVPEFEKVAFSLSKGGTSELVKSSYGFHIIHVDDKQDAHMKSLDEVRAQIEPLIKQQKAARIAEGQANALLTQARANGLEQAAAAKGLQVITTEFFGRSESLPGIGSSPQFADAVFSEGEKSPPDMVQVQQGFVVYKLLAVKPPATPSFEQIRARVEQEFQNERANQLLSQKTQELSDRAKAEHDLKKAAKELGATLKTSDFVLPNGQVPDVGSMTGAASVAFTMKPGEISGPINSGASGAVLQVLEKQEPTSDEFAQKKDEIRDSLVQQKQGERFGLFVNNLRQQMEKAGKIKINEEEMKGLSRGAAEQGE
ncbi:MAG TPA: peptidyl-prolyl cis-trans isomerase [Terriglobales bacterium]|nr:peptidyl-prolyl cis-trans isomerase [Terriglobales bacterium]